MVLASVNISSWLNTSAASNCCASDNGRGGPVDCYPVSRKQLMLEAAKCSLALAGLGLKAGDRIVVDGTGKLRDGARIVETKAPAAGAARS